MTVFVTGATGVLGRSVVKLLVQDGHHVRGLARSERNADLLRQLGAEPVSASLFNPEQLCNAIGESAAVLHLATKIPPRSKVRKLTSWSENDRIRGEGTRNLVNACLTAKVNTLIYPSVTLPYIDSGDQWVNSETPVDATRILLSTLEAEEEVRRFTRSGRRGITLRMAQFYGPEAVHTLEAIQLAKRGVALMFGNNDAYQSSIWVDDAARAVVTALERASAGIYDIADDEPLLRRDLVAAMAAAVGRRRLVRMPQKILRYMAGPHLSSAFARSQRVSNRKFKEESGWTPMMFSAREGWKALMTN